MYYIASKKHLDDAEKFITSAHYIDLPDGTVLLRMVFRHVQAQNIFERQTGVIALPHPVSGEPIGADIAARLAHMGVKESHKTFDVAKFAAKVHPLMRLR